MTDAIRLATRRSPLALAQSGQVAARLHEATGRQVVFVEVVSEGDVSSAPLSSIGGAGVFVAAVREALIADEADIAVHSLKDLPTMAHPDIALAAVPQREDAADVLCSHGVTLKDLPPGATIGTSSPRRAAQVKRLRPDCEVRDVRGNVQTRLDHIGTGVDAVLLAAAGLRRLGLGDRATEVFTPEEMLPAPGQGALAVEARRDLDDDLGRALADLDDPATRACTTAERAMLSALAAGCSAPVGAYAEVYEPGYWQPEIFLRGGVFGAARELRMSITGSAASAEDLGRELAARLLAEGAASLMTERNQ